MKPSACLVAAAALSGGVLASPLDKRAESWCGNFGTASIGPYTVYHNNWGVKQATSGQQCSKLSDLRAGSVAWSTSWSWQGGHGAVKSYPNVGLAHVNKKLTEVKSIPSKFAWRYVYTHPARSL
ncbi:hypothetical protein E4U41_001405 [Claviceps citrina]|nr:hypothetical protein E4U41_001405 [Claviceps citrina]